MWRYIDGVKNPKRQKTNERSEYAKKYEEGRVRKFQDGWLLEFEWLEYTPSEDGGIMICKVCKLSKNTSHGGTVNQFISGCKTFKKETLKYHDKCEFHLKSEAILKAKNAPVGTSQGEKIIASLNASNMEKLSVMFRTVHALAKHCRPFTDFVWQCKLDEMKGFSIGKTYQTNKQAKQFSQHIAAVVREKIELNIKGANFLSVMCDGSTDSAVIEEEILYIRYCKQGTIHVKFIGITQTEKADAKGIFESLQKTLGKVGISKEILEDKLIALGCDGARVMLGHKNGVISLLRQEYGNENLLAVHCFAHRLELGYKESVSKIKLYNNVFDLLVGLYKFYHQSALNRANLKNSCITCNIYFRVPSRVGGTRWVGHVKRAVEHFLGLYPAMKMHLEQIIITGSSKEAIAKAKGFLNQIESKDIILYSAFLLDILVALSKLSEIFQKKEAVVGNVNYAIKNCLQFISNYVSTSGPELRKWENYQFSSESYKATTSLRQSTRSIFLDSKLETVRLLTECIQKRLLETSNDIVTSTTIANFKSWPVKPSSEELAAYGMKEIQYIISQFQQTLVKAQIIPTLAESEFGMLKISLYNENPDNVHSTNWEAVNTKYSDLYPNILGIMDFILTIPVSSSECERGFSAMKRTKTDWRSSLGNHTLSDLLTIELESPNIEDFDPHPAIHHWNNAGCRKRRPEFLRKQEIAGSSSQQSVDESKSNSDSYTDSESE